MKEFYRNYIQEEYNRFRYSNETKVNEQNNIIHTLLYEDVDGIETITIRDIIQEKYQNIQGPVIVLNFENELGFGGYEDKIINCMLEHGIRVLFVKCSFYENADNNECFITQGIGYWKRNMVAMQLCYEYMKKLGYCQDISFIAMNGLSSCSLALIAGNNISCNRIYIINGCMDFQYIFEHNLWEQIFPYGYYSYIHTTMKNPLQDNPELNHMNPFRLFIEAEAEKKLYFGHAMYPENDIIEHIICPSMDDILEKILEEI